MNQLSLPSLSLFNRSPPKTRKELPFVTTTNDHTIYKVLHESQRIQNQAYMPDVLPTGHEDNRLRRYQMEIDYLNAYKDALRRQETSLPVFASSSYPSYQSTHRQDSLHSFGARRQGHQCQCSSLQRKNEKNIVRNAYLAPAPTFTPPPIQNRASQVGLILNKNPYLNRPQDKQTDPSVMKVIGDISKFVNDQKPEHIDKSIMINNSSLRPPVAEIEVQTDDPNMLRGSFLISKVVEKVPELMNQQNFRKTIKRLNQAISSLSIDLSSEDLIIDLSDLVLTKDQYIEQSNALLSKLNSLSSGKIVSMTKNKKEGGIVWPQGV